MDHVEAADRHLVAVDRHRAGPARRGRAGLAARAVRFLQVTTLAVSDPSEEYARTRRFYQARGFTPLEELDGIWPVNPCLLMVKALGRAAVQ